MCSTEITPTNCGSAVPFLKNQSPLSNSAIILLFKQAILQLFPFPLVPMHNLSSPVISCLKMSLKFALPSTILNPVQAFTSSSLENYNSLLTGMPISGYCSTNQPKPTTINVSISYSLLQHTTAITSYGSTSELLSLTFKSIHDLATV